MQAISIISTIIAVSALPILTYIYTKPLKELGVNSSAKISSQTLFSIWSNWLKENWYIHFVLLIMFFLPLFSVFYNPGLKPIIGPILGIDFLLLGLFLLIANYKELPYVINAPNYKLYQIKGHKKFIRTFYYIVSLFLITTGIILFF